MLDRKLVRRRELKIKLWKKKEKFKRDKSYRQ